MPMEKVVNDVRVLCKDKFVLEDESEHNVRQKLSKLVNVFRSNHERSKKKKAKVDKNPSRTKNILVTPCGLRHRHAATPEKKEKGATHCTCVVLG